MDYRATHVITIALLLLVWSRTVSAQQFDEYDYRNYKYYDEGPSELLYSLQDTIEIINTQPLFSSDPLEDMGYTLSSVDNPRRGGGYEEERFSIDGLPIDYATARTLRSVGLYSSASVGLTHASTSGGVGKASLYTLATDAERCYKQQMLRGEFSGKGYLGGLSYSATLLPHNRPARNEDWHTRMYARARAGRDIYVEGVYSYAADIGATLSRVKRNSSLGIALLIPVSERGLRRTSVEEAYTLTANPRYNPAWGIQDGKVRNSRVERRLRPEAIVSWQQRITAITTLHLTADLYYEMHGNSALAWFDAMTPEPDNYRYLPSAQHDDATRREVEEAWLSNNLRYTQLDWEAMYRTNALQRDGRAAYIVENRRSNRLHGALSGLFETRIGNTTLSYGIEAAWHSCREFKVVEDLLGAEHVVDIDYFLIDDNTYASSTHNNLRDKAIEKRQGERYGYDYSLTRRKLSIHGTAVWRRAQMMATASLRIGGEQSLRRGYFEKELFAGGGSYGRSATISLAPYLATIGWSYQTEQHTLRATLLMRGESPMVEHLFLQTQYNNRTIENPSLHHTAAAELTYSYTTSNLKLQATAYCNYNFNDSAVVHYYDDLSSEYADVLTSGIDRLNLGTELAAKVRYNRSFSSTFALVAALSRYTDNAEVQIYADKDNRLLASTTSLMRGCKTSVPAITLYGDVEYRSANSWSANLAACYWGMRHVEPSAERRTLRTLSYATSDEEREALTAQQRLPDAVMVDLSVGKRIRFRTGKRLYLRLTLRNILGSVIIERGYEQSRISRTTIAGQQYISPFANRIRYAYPRTIYLSVGLSF